MPRVISFIVLLAIALLVGAIFFQVMAQFFVPLFLACVLLVIFEPLHRWMSEHLPGRRRLAAFCTTVSIILVVVVPLVWLGWKAYIDFHALLINPTIAGAATQPPSPLPEAKPEVVSIDQSKATKGQQIDGEVKDNRGGLTNKDEQQIHGELKDNLRELAKKLVVPIADKARIKVTDPMIDDGVKWASSYVAKVVVTGLQSILGVLFGLFILVIALYFFLADGPVMVEAVMALSPLDRRYEHELLQRFAQVSRAVVMATLLTALTQGALAGIGYYFALPLEAPFFLLTALTAVSALVPIFGAFAVWACVCIGVYAHGDTVAAIALAIYCTLVVSAIDNIMKPLILHGQSKLHPLLALLSILGGLQAFGPVGILVGPMLVSFLQALLNMLRKELDSFGGKPEGSPSKPLAESMVEAIQMATAENSATGATTIDQPAAENHDSTSAKKSPQSTKAAARHEKRKR